MGEKRIAKVSCSVYSLFLFDKSLSRHSKYIPPAFFLLDFPNIIFSQTNLTFEAEKLKGKF